RHAYEVASQVNRLATNLDQPTTDGKRVWVRRGSELVATVAYFETDQYDRPIVRDASLAALREIMANEKNASVSLLGSTDVRGSEGYNRELGFKRAKYIADQLGREGVPRERIRISSIGESAAASSK